MSADVPESEEHGSEDSSVPNSGYSEDALLSSASLTEKETERARIKAEIEAFLNGGGKITRVESNVMSDPPKAPESNYGGQPI